MLEIPEPLRQPLCEEVAAVRDQLRAADDRALFGQLHAAVDQGQVPPELEEPLARVLRLSLESGRFARVHGPAAEAAARRLFLQTPPGRQLSRQVSELNQALALWQGRTLQQVQLSVRGPGTYALELQGEGARTVILFQPQGVHLQGIEAS